MKKNTKGFTLIELLAVIVILAIIALIAVPVILNILTKSRQSAAEDTAYSVLNAAEIYYAEALLDNPTEAFAVTTFAFSKDETTGAGKVTPALELKGTVPTAGSIRLNANGTAEIVSDLTINGLTCKQSGTTVDCK